MNKKDFPIFKNNKDLVYLDNAATAQKPRVVIDAISDFYMRDNANVYRGLYALSERASGLYEQAREAFARFVGAKPQEIVFAKNATGGLNLVAWGWGRKNCKEGDEIVVSRIEHHSNFLPWQRLAREKGLILRFWNPDKKGVLHIEDLKPLITRRTKAVCVTLVSNVLGAIVPIEKIREVLGKKHIVLVVDAAQAVAHIPVDVSTLRCDFLAFSLHKMYGPMGLGVLFVSENRYREMEPMLVGGGSVRTTDLTRVDYVKPPHLFEAGTPPVAEVVGGMKAIEYLSQIGYDVIRGHEAKLTRMLFEGFKKFPFIRVMSPEEGNVGVVSFVVDGLHPHDVGSLLGEEGVALRVGHHCAIPLHQFFGIHGTARVSLGLYNDEKDIVRFFEALRKIEKII